MEDEELKFRILPLVDGMRIRGVRYRPGSVVDLPDRYLGASYLERVPEEELVAAAPPPSVTEAPEEDPFHQDANALKLAGVGVKARRIPKARAES